MTERYRICKNCEYFDTSGFYSYCHEDSPKYVKAGGVSDFPRVAKDDWCGKWFPKDYLDNPAIKESWDHFVTLHILAVNHD